jgi:hypothetical protein
MVGPLLRAAERGADTIVGPAQREQLWSEIERLSTSDGRTRAHPRTLDRGYVI